MSEYQYYEFQAVDRSLNQRQIAELRALSSRATITPTRFVNVYNFGDFRGDPLVLMERYFDAHVYVANWGTHQLLLAFPRQLLDLDLVQRYAWEEALDVHLRGERVILEFIDRDEEGGDWEEGEAWMPSLLPLRADIAAGDLRALYLAWLRSIQDEPLDDDFEGDVDDELDGELDDEADGAPSGGTLEPPVPPGLGDLTASLKAFAEFLRVDDDLIAAAAERSRPLAQAGPSSDDLERWVRGLSEGDKDALLLRLARGEPHLQAELLRGFRQASAASGSSASTDAGRRSVAELRAAAAARAETRRREEAERAARERARQQAEQARARAAHLDGLVGQEEALWRQAEALVETKRPQDYDRAVQVLVDLRDLAARAGQAPAFGARLADLRLRHAKKPSLLARLDRAGLRASLPLDPSQRSPD